MNECFIEEGYSSLKGLRFKKVNTGNVNYIDVKKDGDAVGFYKFTFEGEGPYNQKAKPECYFNIYPNDADLITGNPQEILSKNLYNLKLLVRIIIDLLVAHLEVVHLIFNIPIVNLNYKYYEKVFISICFFIAFFSSCSDNELEEMSNSVPVSKYPQKVIDISMESPESFSHFSNISITRSSELLKDSVWSDGKGHTLIYETNEHVPTQELMRYIYLGSILQGGSIEKQRFVPVLKPVDPITISYSFPARWVTDIIMKPSLSAQRQSLQNIMNKEGMEGKQLGSFSYNMRQFTYFEELKLAFGANVNIARILDIDISVDKGKIRRKTGLFAKIIQRNYTVDMDLPIDGNLLLNHDEINNIGRYDPVYISSITYGRMALISMESFESYDKLRVALQVALQAKVINGELDFSLEQKKFSKKRK